MAKVVGIDHISISVRNFNKSKEFYHKLFKFLGFKILFQGKDYIGWTNSITRYIIVPVLPKYKKLKHEKGKVGFHHYAFELSKREDVDELYKFLVKYKVRILDAPKEYPEYGGPYYAVYFTDPDGLKLEGMHFPK